MSREVIQHRSRGFISLNAHPQGCARNVERQIDLVARQGIAPGGGPKNVLVVGSSTGYGLASRIAAAWGFRARTLGVFLERPPEGKRTASAGFYNNVAFHRRAHADGLFAASLNADAFSDAAKRDALEIIRSQMQPLDLLIYSLASPRRAHPRTGEVYNSARKPIGAAFTSRTIDLDSERVTEITIEPASEKEIADTVAVMGGDDWRMWIDLLLEEKLLAPGFRTLAYSYIGPQVTWPVYRDGTIGRAKDDLEQAAHAMDTALQQHLGGHAWISVNKAIVTQASAAIPVVPLYMSILRRVMTQKGIEEGAIEQMRRLFFDFLTTGKNFALDAPGRIRLDDREMRPEIQSIVLDIWPRVTTENLAELTDFAGYKREFHNLFGFDVDDVDYSAPVETDVHW